MDTGDHSCCMHTLNTWSSSVHSSCKGNVSVLIYMAYRVQELWGPATLKFWESQLVSSIVNYIVLLLAFARQLWIFKQSRAMCFGWLEPLVGLWHLLYISLTATAGPLSIILGSKLARTGNEHTRGGESYTWFPSLDFSGVKSWEKPFQNHVPWVKERLAFNGDVYR